MSRKSIESGESGETAGYADIEVGRDRSPLVHDEPPVVARLVVEIRSDGSRTIARGALDEVATGQRVAIEARGDSPLQLAWALARSMVEIPLLAGKTMRALLPGRRGRTERK